MCSPETRRTANRYFWMVKGHLIPESWSDEEVEGVAYSYLKRLWGNHENYIHERGFEQAYQERLDNDISKVAVLGYD